VERRDAQGQRSLGLGLASHDDCTHRPPLAEQNEALQKLRWHAFVICPIVLDRLLCTSRYPLQDLRCSVSLSSGCCVLSRSLLFATPHFTPAVCLPGRVCCPLSSLASSPPVNHHHHPHPMTIATAIPYRQPQTATRHVPSLTPCHRSRGVRRPCAETAKRGAAMLKSNNGLIVILIGILWG
jgi:hypothetical protein